MGPGKQFRRTPTFLQHRISLLTPHNPNFAGCTFGHFETGKPSGSMLIWPAHTDTQASSSSTNESRTTMCLDEASATSHPKLTQSQALVSPKQKSTPPQTMRDYTLAITNLKGPPWLTDLMKCSSVQKKLDYVDTRYRDGCQSALQDFAANWTRKGVDNAHLEEFKPRNGVPAADPSVQYVYRINWNRKLLETMALVSQRPVDRQGIFGSRSVSRNEFNSNMTPTNGQILFVLREGALMVSRRNANQSNCDRGTTGRATVSNCCSGKRLHTINSNRSTPVEGSGNPGCGCLAYKYIQIGKADLPDSRKDLKSYLRR
ncbi:hypothetical protein V5O48_008211, partial [Marasmius crinis-equi]